MPTTRTTQTSHVFYADFLIQTGKEDQTDMLLLGEVLNYNCVDITDGVKTETAPTDKQLKSRLKSYKNYKLGGKEPNFKHKPTAKIFTITKTYYKDQYGEEIVGELTAEEQKYADIIADITPPTPEPQSETEYDFLPESETETETETAKETITIAEEEICLHFNKPITELTETEKKISAFYKKRAEREKKEAEEIENLLKQAYEEKNPPLQKRLETSYNKLVDFITNNFELSREQNNELEVLKIEHKKYTNEVIEPKTKTTLYNAKAKNPIRNAKYKHTKKMGLDSGNRKFCPMPSCQMLRGTKEAMLKHLGILEGEEGNGNCRSSFYNLKNAKGEAVCKKCFLPPDGKGSGNKYLEAKKVLDNIDEVLDQLFS
tara:strand:+ start:58 stop:1179 length:1122 start_codon:yes stop_codon:yes gene_type:complete